MKISKNSVPTGTIIDFGGGACPAGYLLCDGSAISRTQYAALFEKIGTIHGAGDGATTFHLPDRRGRFPRGADNMGSGAAGRDPNADTRTASNSGGNTGNTVGSVQSDAMQGHRHSSWYYNLGGPRGATATYDNDRGLVTDLVYDPISDGTNGTPRTSSESRPQNQSTIYAIKY